MSEAPKNRPYPSPEEELALVEERSQYAINYIKEQEEKIARMEEEHGMDALTGVRTRKFFEQSLEQAVKVISGRIQEKRRFGDEDRKGIAVAFIDLDNFKKVNDTLGHEKGDQVIKRAASIMKSTLREEDLLARYGGDEFVVLLKDVTERQAAFVAENLRRGIEDDSALNELSVTASIGVCSSETLESSDPNDFLKRADEALYEVKRSGRNQVAVFTGEKEN